MTNEEKIDLKKEIEEQDGYEYSDELFFTGEGDLLDTAEGRAKFCRINETTVFRKKDPTVWNNYIWVFNNQGVGMTIKRQSHVDPQLMECIDFDADGNRGVAIRAFAPYGPSLYEISFLSETVCRGSFVS